MKKIITILLISIQSIIAQEILNNDSILEMIEIGFEESLIIDKINNSQNTFETSISSPKDLKSKGISQNILSAIIKASKQKTESITNNNSTLTAILGFPILLPTILTSIKASLLCGLGFGWDEVGVYLISLSLLIVVIVALASVLFPYLWRS